MFKIENSPSIKSVLSQSSKFIRQTFFDELTENTSAYEMRIILYSYAFRVLTDSQCVSTKIRNEI